MVRRIAPYGIYGAGGRDTHEDELPAQGSIAYADVSPHDLGIEGERIAAQYLERRGYEILERNWYCPSGEADIIALDDGVHVLVEVKSRLQMPGDDEPVPEDAVDEPKRKRYRGIAQYYLAATEAEDIRFDVIAVSCDMRGAFRIRHIVDAFGGDA